MSFVDQNLISGETVLYKTKLHWSTLVWPSGIITLPIGFICLLSFIGGIANREPAIIVVGVFFLLLDAVLFHLMYAARSASEFAITNKRVVIKLGIVFRTSSAMFFDKIESIGVKQGLFGRIMGYGTVIVKGTSGTLEGFNSVPSPLEFRRQVQQQIDNLDVAPRKATFA